MKSVMKKRIICICAILLVVLLLIVGVSHCSKKSQNSDDGEKAATSGTEQGPNSSTPEEGPTEPAVQPTGAEPPAIAPTEPEVPEVTPSEPEVPETQPTEPEAPETDPVDPEIPEEKPSEPEKEETPEVSKPIEPPKPVEYIQGNGYKRVKNFDPATNMGETRWYLTGEGRFFVYEDEYIFEVRPGTLTYEMWCSWDIHTQVSFEMFCDWSDATIDDKYNYFRITECENYTCGWENHYCSSEDDHQWMLEEMSKGCRYCGSSDCVSFYARGAQGFTVTDSYLCPQYDITKDPMEYCQDCGLRIGYEGCIMFVYDSNCRYCGEWVEAMTCHHCKKYHD